MKKKETEGERKKERQKWRWVNACREVSLEMKSQGDPANIHMNTAILE